MALAQAPSVAPLKEALLPHGRLVVERAMRGQELSVTGLALRLGVSRKHLSNILGGKVPLSESLAKRLALALDLDPTHLSILRHDGIVPPPPHAMMPMNIEILGDPTEPIPGWFED